MKSKFGKIALALAASLALTLVLVPPLAAAPDVSMVIDPTPKTVNVGDTFTVDIKVLITGGEAVDSAAAYLDFNTTFLDVVSITPGVTLGTVLENNFDNVNGTIDYAAGATLGTSPPTTDFVLATVEFTAKAATDGTPLTFVFTPITRKTDALSGGVSVLDEAVDGNVIIEGVVPPAVSMVIDPTPKTVNVGDTFTVDIKVLITGGQPVDSASAYLDFNTTYLDVVSITQGATLGTVLESDFDNVNGTIDYAAGATLGTSPPTTDFVLATVEFTAEAATDGTPLTFVFTPITRKTDALSEGVSVLDEAIDGNVIILPPLEGIQLYEGMTIVPVYPGIDGALPANLPAEAVMVWHQVTADEATIAIPAGTWLSWAKGVPAQFNSLDSLEHGKAYLVSATADCVWSYPTS